ncbi:hypothetical protein GQ600_4045 [Phytophthora cactorum]|nr:hypothetical protein GQ600_4045 [Phytophthora cactorum]
MSLADAGTTTNMAENMGLYYGLMACGRKRWQPLDVIGDSAMIIRQHARRRAPLAPHLRRIYWTTRRHTERLDILMEPPHAELQ